MHERTSPFIETVRNIYLYLNKNYTPFLKLDLLTSDTIDLDLIFTEQLVSEYHRDCELVNDLMMRSDRERNVGFSARFDFRTADSQKAFGAEIMATNIAHAAKLLKNKARAITVLSLGIGDGCAARKFAHVLDLPQTDEMIAIDIHPHYLSEALTNIHGLTTYQFDLNALAKGAQLPVADHSVDIAECAMVAHHIESFGSMLAEVHRILKDGGRFFYLDLIDKTVREEFMRFEYDHQYPEFHGVEFFRDHLAVKEAIGRFLTLKNYIRIGPGILYLEAGKQQRPV